jgi:hypothetical protein
MARLAVISFGCLVLALAAVVAGLDAFTALHPPQGRPGGSVDRQQPHAHASMTADCGRGPTGGK